MKIDLQLGLAGQLMMHTSQNKNNLSSEIKQYQFDIICVQEESEEKER